MVYGISSAPAIWQRTMEQVLQGLSNVQCYLDDIIVTGASNEEHLSRIDDVLTRLEENGLKANREKSVFFRDQIEYCGHVIDKNGLHKSDKKISAVIDAPHPENVSQLRSLLGLVNYYHTFLPDLSTVLHPLHQLLQSNQKWYWGSEQESAFQSVKQLIASDLVLTHYDVGRPLRLETDASSYGIGAVISHVMDNGEERPIAFASRTLSQCEKNYSQIEKEGLSVVWGIKRFNQYLEGRSFTIVTDHQPLLAVFHPNKPVSSTAAARLQQWALFISGYKYNILYRGTTKHANADCLSRLPSSETSGESVDCAELFSLDQVHQMPVNHAELTSETRCDSTLGRVFQLTMSGGWNSEHNRDSDLAPYYLRKDKLTVQGGCVLWGVRMVIPNKLRDHVLKELHVGHLGIVKMKGLSRSYAWWPGIDKQIEMVTKSCRGCQETQRAPDSAPLHSWEFPSKRWQRIHVDFARPFLGKMFLVCVDAHSKWPEVIVMNSTTATQTIEVLRSQFARWGLPEHLVSDNGPQFVSEEFSVFLKQHGILHITSAPYHPATNGLAERFVQSFKRSLRASLHDETSRLTLQHRLNNFLFAYRNTPYSITGQTPASLMVGYNLRSRLDLLRPDVSRTVQRKQLKRSCNKGRMRNFCVGQSVVSRNYSSGPKCVLETILDQTGPISYTVKVGNLVWRRHLDQILATGLQDNSCDREATSVEFGELPLTILYDPLQVLLSSSQTTTMSVSPNLAEATGLPSIPTSTNIAAKLSSPPQQSLPTTTGPIGERCYPTRESRCKPQRLDL